MNPGDTHGPAYVLINYTIQEQPMYILDDIRSARDIGYFAVPEPK